MDRPFMTVNHFFVGYMVLVGLLVGAVLAVAPQLGDFWLKPYFWIMATAFVFDVVVAWRAREVPGLRLAMEWRLVGFAVGITLMIIVLHLTGSPAKYF
jgi:hypothetical protein